MKKRNLLLTLILAICLPWVANGQTVTIGTGTTTDYYTPIGTYHNYSFTEQLYTASEINQTGYILNLGFSYAGTTAKDFPIVVYMKAVSDTDLTGGWISIASTDQVFNGTLSVTGSGWATIELDSPFNYDGTKNLLIAIDKAYLRWYSGGNWNHTSATNMARHYCNDSTDPDPMNPSGAGTSTVTSNRPNVQLTFGVPATCFAPRNLQATLTPGNGTIATLTWNRHALGTENAWVLQYGEDNTFAAGSYTELTNGFTVTTVEGVTTVSANLSSLTAEHTYYARVKPDCDTDGTLWSDVVTFTPTNSYTLFVNETATNSSYYVPFYYSTGSYSSIKSQFVIPSADLAAAQWGTINKLTFYSNTATNNYGTSNFSVYVTEVSNTTLTAMVDWASLTEVYTGTVSVANNLMTINLDSPYTYEGGNLLIGFKLNSIGTSGTSSTWVGSTNNASGVSRYCSSSSTESSSSFLPKMKVEYTAGDAPCCQKPKNLACTGTTGTPATATFTWTNGDDETQWQLEYGTNEDFTGASTATITQSQLANGEYTLNTGLTAETKYYARIKAYCPSCTPNYSDPSNVVDFMPSNEVTECEDFEGVTGTTYSSAGSMPAGWYSYTTATGSSIEAPHVCSGTSYNYYYSSSQSLVFESGANANNNAAYAVMPAVTAGNEYISLSFYTRVENANQGTLQVGYVTAQTEAACGNFTSLTSITSSTTLHQETIDVSSIPSDAFIAFKWQVTGTGTFYACGIDDVCLTSIPVPFPKPRNLVVSDITSSSATLTWQAPASSTPTGYEYQYKEASTTDWSATWTSNGTNLSIPLSGLTASASYDFRVRATYTGGESDPFETQFTTLDDCAFPTGLTATITPGLGTIATLSWTKGYDETEWVLQYGTDNTFTAGTYTEKTDGFTANENTVTANLTGLTPETTYYSRVKAKCSATSSSTWSDVVNFTPTNYADYTFRETANSTTSYVPFYGYYTTSATNQSQLVIPSADLTEIAGGTIRSITYYTSSTATTNWGSVIFDVYMAEVENTTFSSATFIDWTTLTNVYTGTVSLNNGMMTVTFDRNYTYNGGNLLIGFKTNTAGTASQSISWTAYYGSAYNEVHQYSTSNASRSYYQPKITFNYQPTPYKHPVIDEDNSTFSATSAHIAWTVTGVTPSGYQYQYKLASAAEWPTAWTSVTTAYADLTPLNPGALYDFRVKALYEGNHESAAVYYDFWTQCGVITSFPWKEDFEVYSTGDFEHPCWVNQHLSGNGSYIYTISTENTGNRTKQLKLTDQSAGTETMLRLPEMNLPGNDYQFVIDIYRNSNTYQSNPYELEGIHVYVSTNGNLEGATELAYIPRHKDVSNTLIPAELENGWYTYEIPIGISGNCYIILKGVNQFVTSIYTDNFGVEQIPSCARPKDLDYSNVTNHSAKLTWTAGNAEQTLWQLAYSKTSFDPNTANFDVTTVSTIDATANPFTLDKILDEASTYYVYVRPNCGTATEPDYGPWCRDGVSFTTLEASPAPSNFVASNPASTKVDLYWHAGGGDFETWEIYYVASTTDPEAPTAATTATVTNITTLPSNEAPYVLGGLDPVTKYYAWIRAKHVWNSETTYSNWVALTDSYFETLDECPTPYDLAVSNITSVSADLSWTGSDDVTEGYTVEYGLEGTYSVNETEDFSDQTPASYNTEGELPDGWYSYNTNTSGYLPHVCNNYTYGSLSTAFGTDNILIMTTNASNSFAYAIMPQVSDLMSLEFKYEYESTSYGTLTVGYVTDNTGYSTYVPLQTPSKTGSTPKTYSLPASDIATINNAHGYVAFRYESGSSTFYSVGIDDVKVKGGTYTPAATQTAQAEGTSSTISSLTPNKTYIVKVKSNCTNGEWSDPITFTTLPDGNKVFTNATNDGKWSTVGNWMPSGVPTITDTVIIRANATITGDAFAYSITFEGLPRPTLTIADGGSLACDNHVNVTMKKTIHAYPTEAGNRAGYYLIAQPNMSGTAPTNLGMITTESDYDLFAFNYEYEGAEWRNYKVQSFNLEYAKGYLYANAADVELSYTGLVRESKTGIYTMANYDDEDEYSFNGWTLVGNPFPCKATVSLGSSSMHYYRMNENGDDYITDNGPINPWEGIFAQTPNQTYRVTFYRYEGTKASSCLNINLSMGGKLNVRDRAVVRFDEGNTLEKMQFNPNHSKVFIPQDGKDYAVVVAEGNVGEVPVSFKAENNGSYTLSFTSEEVSFSYLHLIDNKTGNDVNLLQTPYYTFDASTSDYESRFRLMFATGSSVNDDNFGFVNASGNFCIFGLEGEATLQVIDVLGHVLSNEQFSGSYEKQLNVAPGVYMIRLIQGNDIKVQKMVVR